MAIRRLGVAAADLRAAYAARVGVSAPELLALEHLDMAGDLSPGELSRRLRLTTGAVTALADRLTERGHVVRSPHPNDRRMLLLHRTEHAAEELRRHIWPMAMDVMAVTDRLAPEELATVGRFLEEVIAVIERHAAEEPAGPA
jgi:DNA-binding MarR family transcriptional regulator